jgi:hypothetical protein
MVDAPFDAWQGNLLNELERLSGSDCDWEREGPHKKGKGCRFHTHLWRESLHRATAQLLYREVIEMDHPIGFRLQVDFPGFLERDISSGDLELPDPRVNALETATIRHAR